MNYDRINGQMKYFVSTPKTESGVRKIPMTDQVYRAFVEQKKLNMMLGRCGDYELDGYRNFIFLNSNQRPYKSFNYILYGIVRNYNREEQEQAKREKREPVLLPMISNHILRHTGCTRMAEAGMDVKVLQTIMGHSDPAVTMKGSGASERRNQKNRLCNIRISHCLRAVAFLPFFHEMG